jgi:UDP-glucose:(heptosyl)LPS alpha-1,3-glucosyltransferase
MKIALSFPGCNRRGGVERIMFECARFLAANHHDVTVFATDYEKSDSRIQHHYVPVPRTPSFLRGPRYFRQCTRMLDRKRFQALNTHGVVCPVGGVQWAQSVHRAWIDRSKDFRPPWSLGRLKMRLNPLHPLILKLEEEHFGKRQYRKVITTTPEVQKDLERYYNVPASDVVVIPNGFAPDEFNPDRRAERRLAERERLGLKPNDVALLLVANELERKGYRTILSALAILKSPRLRLIVIGRPRVEDVLKQARDAGLEGAILACGSTNDVAAYHAAADIFVLPTQYEAFCLAILEALGSGLPVVTTKIPGAENAIQPGVNGLLIADPRSGEELAEALRQLLDDDTRSAYSDRAPGTVRPYQWPVVLKRYESVLCENQI